MVGGGGGGGGGGGDVGGGDGSGVESAAWQAAEFSGPCSVYDFSHGHAERLVTAFGRAAD